MDGARAGAPQATQIADRWHLWHGLAGYVDKTVVRHRGCLRQPSAPEADQAISGEQATTSDDITPPKQTPTAHELKIVTRTKERHAAITALHEQGYSISAIARALNLERPTVRRFATAASLEELLAKTLERASVLDPFEPYLQQRIAEGCHNAAQLTRELKTLGYTGSGQAVRRYVQPLRATLPPPAPGSPGPYQPPPPPPDPPAARKITRWLLTHPDHRTEDETLQLKDVLARCEHLDHLAGHITEFAKLMTTLTGDRDHLAAWMNAVEADDLPDLRSFTTGLRRDLDAVVSGLTMPHSSGPVEGIVNKIKAIKRQMFGRANFDLLKIRVLHAL
ncbi:transposase [Acrocarpospora sp. B8E8]|uniref:transposase n=1 Tax=Acrocarpospora sp. B8E8 TaxID=3153572 RepID=UPI00325E4A1D